MGLLQKAHEEQKRQSEKTSAIRPQCSNCGKIGAKLFVRTIHDTWTEYRSVYVNNPRKFLCVKCAQTVKPSLSLSLSESNKQALKAIPIFDEDGNIFPSTNRKQLELLPQWYPLQYCGECNIKAILLEIIPINDCQVLKIVPEYGQEYYMNIHTSRYGYVLTSCSYNYPLVKSNLPRHVHFKFWFNNKDKPCVTIMYGKQVETLSNLTQGA